MTTLTGVLVRLRVRQVTALLRKAMEDVIFLSAENEELQKQLKHARTWEPRLH